MSIFSELQNIYLGREFILTILYNIVRIQIMRKGVIPMPQKQEKVKTSIKKDLVVRYLDERIWLRARAKALTEGQLTMGEVINKLLEAWLDEKVSIK